MKLILVTGANGQLGSELQYLAKNFSQFTLDFTDYKDLDITDTNQVSAFCSQKKYFAIINCAAYTAVDKAESEKDLAHSINEKGAKNLAVAAFETSAKFIHISTDFIFDGTSSAPILENEIPNPLSVYGASKLAGEQAVLQANAESLIIRTSWVYSSFGNNFVKTILRLCKEKESLNVIYDQIGSPTYARDLASLILNILEKSKSENITGVFNYSNEGVASWYDFAIAIRDIAGLKTKILPIETTQYPTPAVRPKFSLLNKKKIKETFYLEIPYWRSSLESCMQLL